MSTVCRWLASKGIPMVDGAESEVLRVAEDIERFVRGGDTVERAAGRLAGYGVPAALVAEARRRYEVRIGVIRDLRDPRSLLDNALRTGGWYGGPMPDDAFWPAFRERLSASGL